MPAAPTITSPARALLDAAPAGLTVRELQISCLGHAATPEQREELRRQLHEFAAGGKAVFIAGTDRWHWQQQRGGEARTNGSAVPVRREKEGVERDAAALPARPAPPPVAAAPGQKAPPAPGAQGTQQAPAGAPGDGLAQGHKAPPARKRAARGKPGSVTRAVLDVLAAAGRPMWAREVHAALKGRATANSTAGLLSQLRQRGVVVQDVKPGPYRLPDAVPEAAPVPAPSDEAPKTDTADALSHANQVIYRLRRERDDAVLELTERGKRLSVLRRERDRLARENADLRSRVAAARHALGSRKAMAS